MLDINIISGMSVILISGIIVMWFINSLIRSVKV